MLVQALSSAGRPAAPAGVRLATLPRSIALHCLWRVPPTGSCYRMQTLPDAATGRLRAALPSDRTTGTCFRHALASLQSRVVSRRPRIPLQWLGLRAPPTTFNGVRFLVRPCLLSAPQSLAA